MSFPTHCSTHNESENNYLQLEGIVCVIYHDFYAMLSLHVITLMVNYSV